MTWNVKFFQTVRGDHPVEDFIEEQDKATQTKIAHHIRLLVTFGPYLKPPYNKKMANNFYELRISGRVTVRIFYTLFNNEYYLLHAFKKKSQRTPVKELKTALDRIKDMI